MTPPVVLVTRAADQADALVERLAEYDCDVRVLPVIQIDAPSDGGAALSEAFSKLSSYEWLVVTSPNTVRLLPDIQPAEVAPSLKVAAIGPGTAEALQARGWTVQVVSDPHVAEALVAQIPDGSGRVLLPRAKVARDVLPIGLQAKGWTVDVVEAYRTVAVSHAPDALQRTLAGVDVVTFTASSTVRAFVEQVPTALVPRDVACIGPVTAATAEQLGLRPTVVAATHTIAGLVQAMADAKMVQPR